MNKTDHLIQIFTASGLDKHFTTKGVKYFENQNYSKLKFIGNERCIRSIELWDLSQGGGYFRIHYLERAPQWLKAALRSWPGFRAENSAGCSFDGSPLETARALALLLRGRPVY